MVMLETYDTSSYIKVVLPFIELYVPILLAYYKAFFKIGVLSYFSKIQSGKVFVFHEHIHKPRQFIYY